MTTRIINATLVSRAFGEKYDKSAFDTDKFVIFNVEMEFVRMTRSHNKALIVRCMSAMFLALTITPAAWANATGFVGEVPQQDLLDWYYYPVVIPKSKHPIVNNMDAVLFRFTGSIDTVGTSDLKKTILLSSSQYSRLYQAPARVNLGILKNAPPAKMFNKPNLNLAVLVEGSFNSLYANRANEKFVKMLQDSVGLEYKATGNKTSIIFISDGDIIRNDTTRQGDLFPLGFYKYTRQSFANLDLLTNAVDFLCDSSGLVTLNAKNIQLRPLNTPKIKLESKKWKIINLVIPVILIIIFGIAYSFRRIRKYTGKI